MNIKKKFISTCLVVDGHATKSVQEAAPFKNYFLGSWMNFPSEEIPSCQKVIKVFVVVLKLVFF